jgi:hypothetical protein
MQTSGRGGWGRQRVTGAGDGPIGEEVTSAFFLARRGEWRDVEKMPRKNRVGWKEY